MLFSKLLVAFLISVPSILLADDGPMFVPTGGNVVPYKDSTIQLKNEKIVFNLYKETYSVDVYYEFVNNGPAKKITMGFPERPFDDKHSYTVLMDFKAYVNDKEQDIETRNTDFMLIKDEQFSQLLDYTRYHCFDVEFGNNESKMISNHYSAEYQLGDFGEDFTIQYVLETGALWMDSIKQIDIEINFNDFDLEKLKNDKHFVWAGDFPEYMFRSSRADGFRINFDSANFLDNSAHIFLLDCEPDFNLEFSFPLPASYFFTVEETFKNKKYQVLEFKSPEKISTNDKIYSHGGITGPGPTGGAYSIGQLVIKNVPKENSDHYKYSRVKELKLKYKNSAKELPFVDVTHDSLVIHFEDTPGKQSYSFLEPLFLQNMQFEILSVYEGDVSDTIVWKDIYYTTREIEEHYLTGKIEMNDTLGFIKELEENYTDTLTYDGFGKTAIMYAIELENKAFTKFLVENYPRDQNHLYYGYSPLMYALLYQNEDAVKSLLKDSTNLTHKDWQGFNFVHYAAIMGNEEVLDFVYNHMDTRLKEELLKDINGIIECTMPKSHEMSSELTEGRTNILEILLEDCSCTELAYELAVRNGYPGVLSYFIEHGLDPNYKSLDGATPLMNLVKMNGVNIEDVEKLESLGAKPELKDNKDRTILDYVNSQESMATNDLKRALEIYYKGSNR